MQSNTFVRLICVDSQVDLFISIYQSICIFPETLLQDLASPYNKSALVLINLTLIMKFFWATLILHEF